MPRSNEQKVKLLVLYELLKKHTDDSNHLSTDEVIDLLGKNGISVERKALHNDIKILNEWGFEVMSYKKRCHYFYVGYRRYDVSELRILIDAVQSASFISESKTLEFIDKIAELAGDRKAELLKKNIICYDTTKHSNKSVFYSIDALEEAIEQQKQVSFYYFDYDLDKNRVYRKEKERYVVNPLALIFTNDNYYLVCYNDKYKNLSNYRIDRMESLEMEETVFVPLKEFENFNIHKYKKQAFSMFVGETKEVELIVDNILIDVIIDNFGENIRLQKNTGETFRISVKVQISPPFFSWITTFKGGIRIKSPAAAVEGMREFVNHEYTCD